MDEDEQCDIQFAKVSFPEDVRIQQIACGNHHILAVDEKGLLYTWGFGDMEQLGNGKYEDETHPYHVRSKELSVGSVEVYSFKEQACCYDRWRCSALSSSRRGVLSIVFCCVCCIRDSLLYTLVECCNKSSSSLH